MLISNNFTKSYIKAPAIVLSHISSFQIKIDEVNFSCNGREYLVSQTDEIAQINAIFLQKRLVAFKDIKPIDSIRVHLAQFIYEDKKNPGIRCFKSLNENEKQVMFMLADESVREEALKDGHVVQDLKNLNIERVQSGINGYNKIVSKVNFKKNDVVFRSQGINLPFPLPSTIALHNGMHLRLASFASFINHSCEPSIKISIEESDIIGVSNREIHEGDEITYNYLTTEWDMSNPFQCKCGSVSCFGMIRGFKYLDIERQKGLSFTASEAVLRKWVEVMPERAKLSTISSLIKITEGGRLVVNELIQSGEVMFKFTEFQIINDVLKLDFISLRHSSEPSAAIINKKVVALHLLTPGDEITVNLCFLAYELTPFVDKNGKKVIGYVGLSDQEKSRWMHLMDYSVRDICIEKGEKIPSSCPLVEVKPLPNIGSTTFATQDIEKGTRFLHTTGFILPFPTKYTILLGNGKHLLFAGGGQCLAHSCDPNVMVNINQEEECLDVIALRDIKAGDVIAFNYLTTEWDMDSPFPCMCGAKSCFRMIRGYKYLNPEQKIKLKNLTSEAINQLVRSGVLNLPSNLKFHDNSIVASSGISPGIVLFECTHFSLHENYIDLFGIKIHHSDDPNTVLIEGYIISLRRIEIEEVLTVNISLFVYDMVALYPGTFDAKCKGFKYLEEEKKQKLLYLCEPPLRAAAMQDNFVVKSSNSRIIIRKTEEMGQTAFALEDIPSNQKLFHATGLILPFPTMYTICVGENKHLLFGDAAETLAHHCEPNVRVNLLSDYTFEMVTIRSVKAGEKLTFNYLTTEWEMNSPFQCQCDSSLCYKMIQGFKNLSKNEQERLLPLASDFIKLLAKKS